MSLLCHFIWVTGLLSILLLTYWSDNTIMNVCCWLLLIGNIKHMNDIHIKFFVFGFWLCWESWFIYFCLIFSGRYLLYCSNPRLFQDYAYTMAPDVILLMCSIKRNLVCMYICIVEYVSRFFPSYREWKRTKSSSCSHGFTRKIFIYR